MHACTAGASDIGGMMAAAFSSAAIVFNKSDSAYSKQLLSAASSLYVQVRGLTCINCSVCAWLDHSDQSVWAGSDLQ